jgi:hypothetical protein
MSKILNNTISNIKGFLVSLSPEVILDGQTEEEVIRESALIDSKECIIITLQEGQEVLEMQPFPWEWIQDVSQTLVYDDVKEQWVEDPILYKKWLLNILTMLEEESIRSGKLDKPVLKKI